MKKIIILLILVLIYLSMIYCSKENQIKQAKIIVIESSKKIKYAKLSLVNRTRPMPLINGNYLLAITKISKISDKEF